MGGEGEKLVLTTLKDRTEPPSHNPDQSNTTKEQNYYVSTEQTIARGRLSEHNQSLNIK